MGQRSEALFDRDIYCPFYKGTEGGRVIKCEGPYPNTALRLTLSGKRKFDQYRDRYCNTRYCEKCRVYRCIMMKYEEEP